MGAAVEIKLQEIERLQKKLNDFALSGGDKDRLLTSLGNAMVGQTEERFALQKDPKGDPWHELTEAYKKRKGFISTGGILDREGLLKISIIPQLTGKDSILVGSPMEYADYHQSAKDKKRRREFLGLSTDNIDELEDAIDVFLRGKIA
jgi:phage virion morphogenesis protein